jgi:hypothetical protein
MVEREKSGRSPKQSTPILPSTTPISLPGSGADYSFVLPTLMELQRSIGKLTQAVDTIGNELRDQRTKLDKIGKQVYAAIVVLVVVGGILSFFAKGINDIIVHRLEAPVQVLPQTSPPQR